MLFSAAKPLHVRAGFHDIQGVGPGTTVRIKGMDAGKVVQVARKYGLEASRVRAMRGGVEALLLFLDWYGLAVLQISHQGLRHGMLLAYLERGEGWWK